ncbi:MAG TPA: DNA replication and repair protein RecF [Thermoanaerobaculia bacterium]
MQLIETSTHSFRNLAPDPVFFGSGVTLISGENAQGKTNLLEAVATLCGQRSFRRAKPSEMAAAGGGGSFSVSGCWVSDGREERLSVEWQAGAGRRFLRGPKAVSFREASALAPAVFLSPDDRDLLAGPPAERRRFLDRLVMESRPAAGADLVRYERVLASRNALLARSRRAAPAPGELETWTEELVQAGTAVRRHRREALGLWQQHFVELTARAGSPYTEIGITYSAGEETPEGWRAAIAGLARLEAARGYTLAGPHRDDLLWTRHGRPLAAEASAGELHRTVVLARLAQWHAVAKATGRRPLFAVDEFDAGLSARWVDAFLRELPPAETVLVTTASDPERWFPLVDHVLEVRSGSITGRPLSVAVSRQSRS